MWQLDFTSALYLGMRHPSCQLAPWRALTLGQPAALRELAAASIVAARLARLQGRQAACLLPSTLHLYWDLFGMFASEPLAVLVDEASYPIARWGAERAQALGLPLRRFACGDVPALRALVCGWRGRGRRPLILADGVVPGRERQPPLAAYAALARRHGGYLLLDDTQALGVLGPDGGGAARRHGLQGEHVVIAASLAKGFGVPLAVLAGGAALIGRFMARSQTRVHASPPSAAVLAASGRALDINARDGALLRARLAANLAQWRAGLAGAGIACRGGAFPVQHLPGRAHWHAALQAAGVRALAQQGGLTFLLRADHAPAQLARAIGLLDYFARSHDERVI